MMLTDKQKTALREIAQGTVTRELGEYSIWDVKGPASPSVVGWLVAHGFARWDVAASNVDKAELTEAGQDALESGGLVL